MTTSFAKNPRNRVKRAHQRAAYDHETVFAVIDAAPLCHVGYVIDGQPYVTPTLVWRVEDRLYWHGSSASRMLRAVKTGIPVCVTASILDGWVLARSGFHHSANYRAVMAFGSAALEEDTERKDAALIHMVEHFFPGRAAAMRANNAQELKATTLVSMVIEDAAAKIRNGPPVDDDEDMASDIWAGVVPVETKLGMPVDDALLKPGVVRPDMMIRVPGDGALVEIEKSVG